MFRRHRIQFPKRNSTDLQQDEAFFILQTAESPRRIRFHDYQEIYKEPGLYEQVFYERLKCASPEKVATILEAAVEQTSAQFSELRILDLGAGNGMMGEELKRRGASRLVGMDIIAEAYDAAIRDRPGIYDAYYVQDIASLNAEQRSEIESWGLDCMVTVAALGFGDIPVSAFISAFNIIKREGWVAFNIKETFFDRGDNSGFSRMIRELIFSKFMDVYHVERYRHRLSIDGEPLYYVAIVGRKNSNVTEAFLRDFGAQRAQLKLAR